MPPSENQQLMSARERLIERMQQRYPDRDFAAPAGESSETSGDALGQAILDTLDEFSARDAEYSSKSKALTDLFYSDPRSMEFIQKWLDYVDPRAALVDTFGDELEDLATKEGRERFKEGAAAWSQRKAANDKLNAEADANWQNSLQALEDWGNEKGLTQDQKVNIMVRLIGIAANGLVNKYGPAEFDLAWRADKYDSAVAAARHEGEVAGRNAKIDEMRARRSVANAMPPSPVGQSGRLRRAPENVSAFDGIE